MEQGADWDQQWENEQFDPNAVSWEGRSPRFRAQERLVSSHFGGFGGLRVIEIGAGRGTAAALYAMRGADVVLFDSSSVALEQARALFAGLGLHADCVLGDAFDLPPDLLDRFDVAMSFGLCEHFVGEHRRDIVAAHLRVLRSGGFAFVSVPNRLSPVYRLWMATLKRMGRWELGTEVPFTAAELSQIVREAGGEPILTCYGSFVASVVGHNLNVLLAKTMSRKVAVPQLRAPLLDRLAYDVSVAARRV